MTKRAILLSLPAAAAALLMAAPAFAQSNCRPDDLLCLEVEVGPGRGTFRIGGGDPVPAPPPPVVVQPAPEPPVVYVEPQQPVPAPPPPVAQPPVVYVQPAPPPPPQTVYVQQPPVTQRRVVQDRYPYSSLGLQLHADGLFGEDLFMGGGGAGFRIRPMPHIAIDLGAGLYAGQDYNGLDRVEVPVTTDLLFFFNPQHRFQFYALVGVGMSWSHAEGMNVHTNQFVSREYFHLGGQAGLGLEWRISRGFALNVDVRGFIRHRIDESSEPEFTERVDGRWQSTDLSGGLVSRVGMTFYFAD
jgi:hypothetical protein